MINRGKGGEDAAQELARFDRDVLAEHPDLVIWQLGTNAVLRRDDVSGDGELIRRGVAQLDDGRRRRRADGHAIRPPRAGAAGPRGHGAADRRGGGERACRPVPRFEIMRYWQDGPIAAEAPPMIGPDGLHMTDRGYGCLAAELADALAANWRAQRDAGPLARIPLRYPGPPPGRSPARLSRRSTQRRRRLTGAATRRSRPPPGVATKGRVNPCGSILSPPCSSRAWVAAGAGDFARGAEKSVWDSRSGHICCGNIHRGPQYVVGFPSIQGRLWGSQRPVTIP